MTVRISSRTITDRIIRPGKESYQSLLSCFETTLVTFFYFGNMVFANDDNSLLFMCLSSNGFLTLSIHLKFADMFLCKNRNCHHFSIVGAYFVAFKPMKMSATTKTMN